MKKTILIIAVLIVVALLVGVGIYMAVQENDTPNTQNPTGTSATDPTKTTESQYVPGDPAEESYPNLSDNPFQVAPEDLPSSDKRKDYDGDGLNKIDEVTHGTDLYKVDTDADGISDYDEIETTKTDPLKWSSRDDNVSDLEYWMTREEGFEAGWTAEDFSDFKVYLAKPEDRLWIIRKVSADAFAELETVSEAYQIDNFEGTLGVDLSRFVEDVAKSIAIYKVNENGQCVKEQTAIDAGVLMFPVEDDDIFVMVYEPVEGAEETE